MVGTRSFAHPTIPFEPVTLMPHLRLLLAAAASLSLSSLAIAQPAPAPIRPAPARPAAVAPVPGQQPPAAVIAAFWGLESSVGAELGKLHTLPSLVSLAYDCRRSEMFSKETIAALKIIDRGDLTPDEMIGSWAGELGQTQFLPTHYFNYAVDYDGDGHRNLLRSAPDVIGSTANYIATGLK